MTKLFGAELRESIEAQKARLIEEARDRNERISKWETDEDDCFLSMRVSQNALAECDLKLSILSGDGLMDFDAIFDENDEEVCVRVVNTRYGLKYVGNGIFANSEKALLKKTGWHKKTIRVPAWTKFVTSGSGMVGVYSGSYQLVRWHTNMVTGEHVGYPY